MPTSLRSALAPLLLAASTVACAELGESRAEPAGGALARGSALFERHCSVCHGVDGRGDGEARPFLLPPARDFTRGRFRLVSTANGAPTEDDLVAVLRRGMPGSAMPSWDWLSGADLASLARHVRTLAVEGLADRLAEGARERGEVLARDDARALAARRLEPGPGVPIPDASEPVDLERGSALFRAHCAPCHGEDGSGGSTPRFDEDGELDWARDLTAGFVKGGATTAAIARRIGAGMPGTAMGPTRLPEEDLAALVAWVVDLVPERTDERFVQRAERLRARRVHSVPGDPDAAGWSSADEIRVVLAPLWWRDESIVYAALSALHDGERIALRVRWPDTTGPGAPLGEAAADGVALQLSAAPEPVLFGMGSAEHPTSIWHWRSARPSDTAGLLDLVDPPHQASDRVLRHLLEGVPAVSRAVDELRADGVGSPAERAHGSRQVRAVPRWRESEWAVVFTRALAAGERDDVELVPGAALQVALAIWNGAAGDRGGQKSVSIWQELALD